VPPLEPLSAATLLAIAALILGIVCLWLVPAVWTVAAGAVVILGYLAGVMHGPAGLWFLILAAAVRRVRARPARARIAAIVVTVVLGVLLGIHVLPGFSNPLVIRDAVLALGARPYSQYVNFDKTLGGLILLGASGWVPMRSAVEWRDALRLAAPWIVLTTAAAMGASLLLGFVRFDPHWSPLFLVWAPINLLTTCVSEEAFFRGFVQKGTQQKVAPVARGIYGDAVTVLASGALFGLAHLAGGWRYVCVASVAGVGYAVVYRLTARVEMAIVTHFTVNAMHFLLFTYPSLA
jgi:membrane protease YdiL (CAAX protease family)